MTGPFPPLRLVTRSVEDTRDVGHALAAVLRAGDVAALAGDLGAGKTALVQGIARGLGSEDRVGSPTFTLVRQYSSRLPILHMDVYRLDRVQDVFDLGFDELADPSAVLLIEWGEAIEGILPADHLLVRMTLSDDDRPDLRSVVVEGHGGTWEARRGAVVDALAPWTDGGP